MARAVQYVADENDCLWSINHNDDDTELVGVAIHMRKEESTVPSIWLVMCTGFSLEVA